MRKTWLLCLTAAALASAAPAVRAGILLMNGAGATFPYPIYSKWFAEYAKVNPGVNFNYQSIGSGGGIRQISSGTVDFGASDGPMTDDQLKAAPAELMHLPTVLGGVVVTYNIPGVTATLRFPQKVLADIYLGKITRWNDPALAGANPGVNLPAQDIVVVHRSDGSGTSYIWTDFLSKVSPTWAKAVGKGTSVNWPVGLGGKGNEGVAGLVAQTPNSVGYVELGYAVSNKLPYGTVANTSGEYVECTLESVSKAAAAAANNMPADFRVSITNGSGAGVYPIASFTWLLVYRNQSDPVKGKALVDFLNWMLENGGKYAAELGYAPLPENVIKLERAAVAKITVKGV